MSKRKEFNSEAKRLTSTEQVDYFLISGYVSQTKQTAIEKDTNGYDQGKRLLKNWRKLEVRI